MTKSRNTSKNKPQTVRKPACQLVDCTDCLHAQLIQYDAPRDPLLAECQAKPQPYSSTHPYAVEVARAKKICPMHHHVDTEKWIQRREKVRRTAQACYVRSQASAA